MRDPRGMLPLIFFLASHVLRRAGAFNPADLRVERMSSAEQPTQTRIKELRRKASTYTASPGVSQLRRTIPVFTEVELQA